MLSGEGARRSPWWAVLPALAAYVALRAFVLAGGFDSTCQPVFELTLSGNAAHLWLGALLRGEAGPPPWLSYDNSGGQLFGGLCALPLYALLGESYLALKLVPLAMGAATLVLVHRLLDERAGPRAAQVGAFVLALGPPTLVQLSTMALGSHFEGLLPMTATYLLWWRWQDEPASRARALAFGLAAGLAVFLYFGALLLVALCLGAQAWMRGPRELARALWRALPGLLVGLAPLVLIQLASDAPAGFLEYNFSVLGEPDPARWLARARRFALEILPRGGAFDDLWILPGALGDALWLAATFGAWALVATSIARALFAPAGSAARALAAALVPVLGWLPAILAVSVFSRFEFKSAGWPLEAVGYRYLTGHFWASALLLGFVAAELRTGGRARRVLASGVLLAALCALPFSWSLVGRDPSSLAAGAAYAGWHGPLYGRVILREALPRPERGRPEWKLERVVPWLATLPEEEREEVLFGVGHLVGFHPLSGSDPQVGAEAMRAPAELFAPWPAELRPALTRGWGSALGKRVRAGRLAPESVRALLARVHADDPASARLATEGLAIDAAYPLRSWAYRRIESLGALAACVPQTQADLGEAFARGLGRAAGLAGAGRSEDELEALHAACDGREESFRIGLDEGRLGAGRP